MLVLTRKNGESIRVAGGIIFTVLECIGGQVKIGISAPARLSIHREEVYQRIRKENIAAARGPDTMNVLLKSTPEKLREIAGGGKATGEKPSHD